MYERGITTPIALACVFAGEKSPGWLGAVRHYLMGFTAVTKRAGKKIILLTAYPGRPNDIGVEVEPCRILRDPHDSVMPKAGSFCQVSRTARVG